MSMHPDKSESSDYIVRLENRIHEHEELLDKIENVLKHNAEKPAIRDLLARIHEFKNND